MHPTGAMILGLFMRWLHISCVVLLIGSVFYALRTTKKFAPSFGPTVYAGIGGIVLSGLYNFFTKPYYPPSYHMWFGIKMLLVLHVLAALILLVRKSARDAAGQARSMTGVLISGAIIIGISAYLRWISLTPVVKP
jgi:hypothetical protein